MTTIEKRRPLLTLINVFTVDPGRQDELVTLLADAIPHMKAAAALAKFDPILCEVVEAID